MPERDTLDLTSPQRRDGRHRYLRRQLWSLRPGQQPVPFELIWLKCGLLSLTGRYVSASTLLSAHLPRAEAMGDRRWAAAMAADLAYALTVQGQAGSALPHAERAKALFQEMGDEDGLAGASFTLAGIYGELEQNERAHRLMKDLLELAERTGRAALSVRTIFFLREELGLDRAAARIGEHLDRARRENDKPLTSMACFFLGDIYMNTGRWAEAEACNLEQYRLAREIGDRKGMSFAVGDRGLLLYGQGRYREAVECYLEKLEISESMGDFYNVFEALVNAGTAYQELGELHAALEYFERAEAHTRRHQVRHHLAKSLHLKAHCLLEMGDHRKAAQANREAMEIAEDIGYSFVQFYGGLLEARLTALSERQRGLEMMEELLSRSGDDQERAEVGYERYRLTKDPKHKEAALEYCRRHYRQSKLHDVARRIAELEA